MQELIGEVIENRRLTKDVYEIKLRLNEAVTMKAGQFVEVKVEGCYLRRPISICDYEDGVLTLLYKVVGVGTRKMSDLKIGDCLNLLGPCGNGFSVKDVSNCVVVGGGIGMAPLYMLCKELRRFGACKAVFGVRSEADLYYVDEFRALGIDLVLVSEDGSAGTKGYVSDVLERESYVYACGPMGMLQAVNQVVLDGQYSLEARMACGMGACMGCSILTANGSKRVCKEGPVFDGKELLW